MIFFFFITVVLVLGYLMCCEYKKTLTEFKRTNITQILFQHNVFFMHMQYADDLKKKNPCRENMIKSPWPKWSFIWFFFFPHLCLDWRNQAASQNFSWNCKTIFLTNLFTWTCPSPDTICNILYRHPIFEHRTRSI